MKKILIALLAVLAAGAAVGLLIPAAQNMKFKNDELVSCSWSAGGGMLGGYRETVLKREGDGAVLTVSEKETHADRLVTTTYRIGPEGFGRLRDIADRAGLYRASKRPVSKLQVMDGETYTVRFSYEKGSFSVSSNQVLSARMREGFWAVADCLSSLAAGEGTVETEPQRAMLYLKSGYTLQFVVEAAFDGRLDGILQEECEVAPFGDRGIVLAAEAPALDGAEPTADAQPGDLVYDPESGMIVLLYGEPAFDKPVFLLARLDGYAASACPLIAEMEGPYRLYLN